MTIARCKSADRVLNTRASALTVASVVAATLVGCSAAETEGAEVAWTQASNIDQDAAVAAKEAQSDDASTDASTDANDTRATSSLKWRIEAQALKVIRNGQAIAANGKDVTIEYYRPELLINELAPDPPIVPISFKESLNGCKDGDSRKLNVALELPSVRSGNTVIFRAKISTNKESCVIAGRHVLSEGGALGATISNTTYSSGAWTNTVSCEGGGGGPLNEALKVSLEYRFATRSGS